MHRLTTVLLLVGTATAQQASWPRLAPLGSLPDAPRLHVTTRGVLGAEALPATQAEVVLCCDAEAECNRIDEALQAAVAHGARIVFFAATDREGRPGGLALALPEAKGDVATTLTLRAHRQRAGVPMRSAVPLLTRLRAGYELGGEHAFALAIEVPGNATCQQVLSLLAAATEAGVQSAHLRVRTTRNEPGTATLALDVEGAVGAQVVAIDPPPVPAARAEARVGLLRAPPPLSAPPREEPVPDVHIAWLAATQLPNGAAGEGGVADVEATSLAALAHVGEGTSLDEGTWREPVRRYVGWLLAQQRADGSFEARSEGSLQRYAQATYALAEATRRSASGALLRTAVADATRFLLSQKRREGGFGPSCGVPCTAVATAWAFVAITGAQRCSAIPGDARELVAWFDRFGDDAPSAAGAELLCRYLAGQDEKSAPRIAHLTKIALQTDLGDPQATFWATFALLQHGGAEFTAYGKRVTKDVLRTQRNDGDARGSWHARGGASATTTTAFYILALEAYYRNARLLLAE